MEKSQRDALIVTDYQNGISYDVLMVSYNISKTQLYRILKESNVTLIDRSHPCSRPEWIEPRLSAGMTERAMSAEAEVSHGTMKSWILRHKGTQSKRKVVDPIPVELPIGWDTMEWFKQKYETEGLGAPSIAKLLGKKFGFVNHRLDKYGIQRRSIKQSMAKHRTRPTAEWLRDRYSNSMWSINKCAEEFGVSYDTILDALRDYGIEERTTTEQFAGALNPFFGKEHTAETKVMCAQIGSVAGKEYWTTGDIDAKRELASIIAKDCWSDPNRRQLASKRIAELCASGGCNSHTEIYYTKSGESLALCSSWESAVARFLDNCNCNWRYQELIIPYEDDGIVKSFVVDFTVYWNDGLITHIETKNKHLLQKQKEQNKINALVEHGKRTGETIIVISDQSEILKLSGMVDRIVWRSANLFEVPKKYGDDSELSKEVLMHRIIDRVCPWIDPEFPDDEIGRDLLRLRDENLDSYQQNGQLRSTAPNGGGMPGRVITSQFFKHFWHASPKRSLKLPLAFDDPSIIYDCLKTSIKEKESLSFERLLREINFHYSKFGRVSLFAPGLARTIIRMFNVSGKRIFDPCCGWGGRLLGAYFEGCSYLGCDVSPLTHGCLHNLANRLNYSVDIQCNSCVDIEWPESDFILTSPPFYDVELYVGGDQAWRTVKSREDWIESFVKPFLAKVGKTPCALYLDKKTAEEFIALREPNQFIEVGNRRHSRRKSGFEYLVCYNV